jgi:type 1 glutamine amidotransferase
MNRRSFLLSVPALLGAQTLPDDQREQILAAIPASAARKPKRPRRLLIVTLTMRDGKPVRSSSYAAFPAATLAFDLLGKQTGAYEPVFSNDLDNFRPDRLRRFDGICFLNTVGVLFDDPVLRGSLLSFISSGKGFIGIHDAIATFVQYPKYDQWPAFGKLLGGTENGGHPWDGVRMAVKVEDPKNPVNAAFRGAGFSVTDQAFQLQEPILRDHLHVLLSIDVANTPTAPRRILKARSEDKDFPVSWLRRHGKGRVFYSSLGHGAPIYSNPALLAHFLAGIQYALGDLKADDRV